jgi:hypothetical protein
LGFLLAGKRLLDRSLAAGKSELMAESAEGPST